MKKPGVFQIKACVLAVHTVYERQTQDSNPTGFEYLPIASVTQYMTFENSMPISMAFKSFKWYLNG